MNGREDIKKEKATQRYKEDEEKVSFYRLSTWRFIPKGNQVSRVLIHLPPYTFHRHGSWLADAHILKATCPTCNGGITNRRCGLQYVGETGQPLHARVSGYQFGITHRRTDVFPSFSVHLWVSFSFFMSSHPFVTTPSLED